MRIETKPVYDDRDLGRYNTANTLEKKRNILEGTSVTTDADFMRYMFDFDLMPDQIGNKKILDLGSGKKETFSKEAAVYGAKVFSLNPKLKNWWTRMQVKRFGFDRSWQKKSAAGRFQELPFKDGAFDIILARWSFPSFLRDEHEKYRSFQDIMRVLKEGGKFYISPINVYLNENLKHMKSKVDFSNSENMTNGLKDILGEKVVDLITKSNLKIEQVGMENRSVCIEKNTDSSKTE
jgi:SAM-dependent methyltransferase